MVVLQNQILQIRKYQSLKKKELLKADIEQATITIDEINNNQNSENNELADLEVLIAQVAENLKELQRNSAAANKELAQFEKQEIELKETEKFLFQKRKKLNKTLTDVNRFLKRKNIKKPMTVFGFQILIAMFLETSLI